MQSFQTQKQTNIYKHKKIKVMLYYSFFNYQGFKNLFGMQSHGNGNVSRRNKILLSMMKDKQFFNAIRTAPLKRRWANEVLTDEERESIIRDFRCLQTMSALRLLCIKLFGEFKPLTGWDCNLELDNDEYLCHDCRYEREQDYMEEHADDEDGRFRYDCVDNMWYDTEECYDVEVLYYDDNTGTRIQGYTRAWNKHRLAEYDGKYYYGNCRWALSKERNENVRTPNEFTEIRTVDGFEWYCVA